VKPFLAWTGFSAAHEQGSRQLSYRVCLAAIAVFCIVIVYASLGSIPLLSLNEARRAVPVTVMHATGDWLLPRLNGELYLDKPPLFYWLAASISAVAGGVNEWTLRLPSALSATSILAMTFYTPVNISIAPPRLARVSCC